MQQMARYGGDDIDEEKAIEKFLHVESASRCCWTSPYWQSRR
jgi:hypothetical protein